MQNARQAGDGQRLPALQPAHRPFNLFHRANLSMRTKEVSRSFGNKTTWERPFETHFRQAAHVANLAVFEDQRQHRALSQDALTCEATAELVYLDPPYANAR